MRTDLLLVVLLQTLCKQYGTQIWTDIVNINSLTILAITILFIIIVNVPVVVNNINFVDVVVVIIIIIPIINFCYFYYYNGDDNYHCSNTHIKQLSYNTGTGWEQRVRLSGNPARQRIPPW